MKRCSAPHLSAVLALLLVANAHLGASAPGRLRQRPCRDDRCKLRRHAAEDEEPASEVLDPELGHGHDASSSRAAAMRLKETALESVSRRSPSTPLLLSGAGGSRALTSLENTSVQIIPLANITEGATLEHYLSLYQSEAARVTEILLSSAGLTGAIPSAIVEFQNLEVLDLQGNGALAGELPAAVSQLSRLRLLDLSDTGVGGRLADGLGDRGMPFLEHLLLADAEFGGTLPPSLANFSALITLDLGSNLMSGSLPEGIAGLTLLQLLDLRRNDLTGAIPAAIGSLRDLTYLNLRSNALSSSLPRAIGNLTALTEIYAYSNRLSGPLPPSLGNLSSIENFYLNSNSFTGSVPDAIGRLKTMVNMGISHNSMHGSLPEAIGGLEAVRYLSLGVNSFSGSLPLSVGLCQALELLYIYDNSFTGPLPMAIGNLSALRVIYAYRNDLAGSLPDAVGMLQALQLIYAFSNDLAGSLPDAVGMLQALRTLHLSYNALAGSLPDAVGMLQALRTLDLSYNALRGTLPDALANATSLQDLNARNNALEGALPDGLAAVQSLTSLNLAFSQLSGSLPDGIFTNLTSLRHLWIFGDTSLSGTLPESLWRLTNLEDLYLWENVFSGSIPSKIGQLTSMTKLFLSGCNFSGEIPQEVFLLTDLQRLSFSSNGRLEGAIPDAVGGLRQLVFLLLGSTKMKGTLPAAIGNLSSLERFDLEGTDVGGTLPATLGGCTSLTSFDIGGSQFQGTLPPELSRASEMRLFYANNNRFAGTLPQEYGKWTNLETYDISSNFFVGTVDANAIPLVSLQVLSLEKNTGLGGTLPALDAATSLTTLLAATCNFTSTHAMPPSLQHVDLSGNRLNRLPEGLYVLPNVESLLLQGNLISFWPPKGAYAMERLAVETCGTKVLETPFEWSNIKVLDVSQNPLAIHVYMFLQTIFWSRSLSELRAQRCALYGDIPRFMFRTSWGASNCDGHSLEMNGLQSLLRLDLGDNLITRIIPEPSPILLLARFDNNKLSHLSRSWFNEGFDQETQARRYSISSLNITGNPDLRFSVLPPYAECGPLTAAAGLSADPRSLEHTTGAAAVDEPFECGSPCPPSGMSLSTDAGIPDEGNLCRCKEGHGLLPDQCWDEHWADASGVSCRDHVDLGSCNSAEAASVCCGCGGQGGGGNGKYCTRCPANTYSFSGQDLYRHRSQCLSCPEGAATAHSEDGGGGSSVCDCQCPIGTYLEGGDDCQLSALQRALANRSFTGQERCLPCHFLKTTLKKGSLSESDCICDILSIPGLVDAAPLCGCGQGYFLNTERRLCELCSGEGEQCNWNGDMEASVKPPELQPGYWAATTWQIGLNESMSANWTFKGHSIYKCFSTEACVDSRGSCARGRGGVACSLCRPGFYGGSEGACLECRGSAFAGLVGMVMSIPMVIVGAHLMLAGAGSDQKGLVQALRAFRVSLKQFVTHLQVVSIVGGFSIQWPLDVKRVFEIVSKYTFRLTDAFGVGCLHDQQSASLELGFRYLFPIVFVIVGIFLTPLAAGILARLLRLCIPKESRLEKIQRRMSMSLRDAARAVFWCYALFFATFFQFGLMLFTCNLNPNGERTVQSYPHLHCIGSKSGADDEWLKLAAPAATYTVVCLVTTIAIYYRAWKKTWFYLEESDLQNRGGSAFLFEDFRNSGIHWPMILLARHALVNLTGAGLSGFGPWQLLTTAVVNAVIAVMCLMQNPYIDASNTFMETFNACALVTVCTFTAGMGFAREPGVQDLQTLASGASADSAFSLRAKMLLFFQLMLILGPLLVVMYQLIILVPFMQNYLPQSIRPLKPDEEEDIRHFLREAARVEGAAGEHDLHRIFDKLDGQELLHISRYLQTAPAAVGVLRSRGQGARIHDLVQRGRTRRLGAGESGCGTSNVGSLVTPATSNEVESNRQLVQDDHCFEQKEAEVHIVAAIVEEDLPTSKDSVSLNTGEPAAAKSCEPIFAPERGDVLLRL